MTRKRTGSRWCFFCGGRAEADFVDNSGAPYKGCSRACCRLLTHDEIAAGERSARRPEGRDLPRCERRES